MTARFERWRVIEIVEEAISEQVSADGFKCDQTRELEERIKDKFDQTDA